MHLLMRVRAENGSLGLRNAIYVRKRSRRIDRVVNSFVTPSIVADIVCFNECLLFIYYVGVY